MRLWVAPDDPDSSMPHPDQMFHRHVASLEIICRDKAKLFIVLDAPQNRADRLSKSSNQGFAPDGK